MRKDDTNTFEFVLKINDNIICQRYFNVKNYNPKFRESLEVVDMLSDVMGIGDSYNLGIIPDFFKRKCVNKTWEYYNPSYRPRYSSYKDIYETVDDFKFEVIVDREVVATTNVSANLFQYNVRRFVDIREIIPTITKTLAYYMELNEYTTMYGDVELKRLNKHNGRR